MCSRPFRQGVMEYGCGQCLPCRINRRRLWTARLLLESLLHERSVFVTLTYDPEHYPANGSVSVGEVQRFFKRLRKLVAPVALRYFAVGEYGERSARAHYHAVIFGNVSVEHIRLAWARGFVHVGRVSAESCAYTAGYLMKKMTKFGDPRLKGRAPEFARMSLRPGLGAGAMELFARPLMTDYGSRSLVEHGDVPAVFRAVGKLWPFGRYLRRCLRRDVGWAVYGEPLRSLQRRALQLVAEFSQWDVYQLREQKRQQDVWRAERRLSISRGKVDVL